jgi:Fe-S-cluster-containing dehydrogenase component
VCRKARPTAKLFHRKRPQQSRINQTEDRSIRPDAERHGNDGKRSEAGLFHELAKTEADILQKCFHKCASFCILRCTAGALWIQEMSGILRFPIPE